MDKIMSLKVFVELKAYAFGELHIFSVAFTVQQSGDN